MRTPNQRAAKALQFRTNWPYPACLRLTRALGAIRIMEVVASIGRGSVKPTLYFDLWTEFEDNQRLAAESKRAANDV
jgi:hypothetical protein